MLIESGTSILRSSIRKTDRKSNGTPIRIEAGEFIVATLEYTPLSRMETTSDPLNTYRTFVEKIMKEPRFMLQETPLNKVRLPPIGIQQAQFPMCLIYKNNKSVTVLRTEAGKDAFDPNVHIYMNKDSNIYNALISNRLMKDMSIAMVYGIKEDGKFYKLEDDDAVRKYVDYCKKSSVKYDSVKIHGMQPPLKLLFEPKLYAKRSGSEYKFKEVSIS